MTSRWAVCGVTQKLSPFDHWFTANIDVLLGLFLIHVDNVDDVDDDDHDVDVDDDDDDIGNGFDDDDEGEDGDDDFDDVDDDDIDDADVDDGDDFEAHDDGDDDDDYDDDDGHDFVPCYTADRFTLILDGATEKFKEVRKEDMKKVELKIEELCLALIASSSTKFCQRHAQALLGGFQAILEFKCDAGKMATLLKELDEVINFAPCPKTTLAKVLGTRAAFVTEHLQANKDFYGNVKQALSILVPLLKTPNELTPDTLMNASLTPCVEVFQNEKVLENVCKLFPRIAGFLTRLIQSVACSAKVVLAHHSSSNVAFFKQFKNNDLKLESLMVKELVGSVADIGNEDEAIKAVSYGKIFELYFAKIAEEINTCTLLEKKDDPSSAFSLTCRSFCGAASLLPLVGHLVCFEDIMQKSNGKHSMIEKLEADGWSQGDQLQENSQLQHLVVPWPLFFVVKGNVRDVNIILYHIKS